MLAMLAVFARTSPAFFIPALSHFLANPEFDRYTYPASPARCGNRAASERKRGQAKYD